MDKYKVQVLIEDTGEEVCGELMASSEVEAESMYKNSLKWSENYKDSKFKVVSITKLTNPDIKRLNRTPS